MKPIFHVLAATLCLSSSAVSAQPTAPVTYICNTPNGIVFTNQKISSQCTASHVDGSATVSNEEADRAVPETVNLKEAIGQAAPDLDDIKILERTRSGSVTNTAEAANPRLDIRLRNQAANTKNAKARAAEYNRKAKILPAPASAPAKAQLSRKQILQKEVRNEQNALARAQAQLAAARRQGDQAKINRLTRDVSDRQAGIRAMQSEMNR